MNEDADLAAEAFRAGASAYLLKRSAASELLTAIREVMRGALVRDAAHHRGAGWLAPARRRHAAEPRTDAAAAGSAAAARRGPLDEGGGQPPQPHAADGGVPQVPNDGAAQGQVDARSSSSMPSSTTSSERGPAAIRVLLVDDNQAMLARAAAVLAAACVVVGQAQDGACSAGRGGDAWCRTSSCSTSRCRGCPASRSRRALRARRFDGRRSCSSPFTRTPSSIEAAQAAGGIGYVVKARLGFRPAARGARSTRRRPFVSVAALNPTRPVTAALDARSRPPTIPPAPGRPECPRAPDPRGWL